MTIDKAISILNGYKKIYGGAMELYTQKEPLSKYKGLDRIDSIEHIDATHNSPIVINDRFGGIDEIIMEKRLLTIRSEPAFANDYKRTNSKIQRTKNDLRSNWKDTWCK